MSRAVVTATSALFVPGDRPERFEKGSASGADVVILDLEDAVADNRKAQAREAVRAHGLDPGSVLVRINAAGSEHYQADLAAISGVELAGVMVAKAEDPSLLRHLAASLPSHVVIVPLIESAAGLASLPELLQSGPRCRAAFGAFDYALDLDCRPTWDALLLARSELVLRSRLAGCPPPLDAPSIELDAVNAIEAESRRASDLGFGGKLAIHPRQVPVIRKAFVPEEAVVDWALRVVSSAQHGGALRIDGQMIDKPLLERASRILARAGRTPEIQ